MNQNNLIFSHITVSNTLLYPAHCCVHTCQKVNLFTFHMSTYCACEAPKLNITTGLVSQYATVSGSKEESITFMKFMRAACLIFKKMISNTTVLEFMKIIIDIIHTVYNPSFMQKLLKIWFCM